ncbi:MAG TPA: DUF4907 domain-containing protein [Puia sp.]|nr:DUF4907 domain-containing protein [Puia sp.]
MVTALLCCSAVIFFAYHRNKPAPTDRVFLHVEPFEKPDGWGYDIYADNKVYIHQDYIPVIQGFHRFKSKEDALRTGNRMIEKIAANQSPGLTWKDIEELGLAKK